MTTATGVAINVPRAGDKAMISSKTSPPFIAAIATPIAHHVESRSFLVRFEIPKGFGDPQVLTAWVKRGNVTKKDKPEEILASWQVVDEPETSENVEV